MKKALFAFFILIFFLSLAGCGRIDYDIFGKTNQQPVEEASGTEEIKEEEKTTNVPDDDQGGQQPAETKQQDESTGLTTQNREQGPMDHIFPPFSQAYIAETDIDIETAREYFKEGVSLFEEEDYLLSEYYLNRIKDDYEVLSDHIYYYLAKSLLLQEKYDLSEQNYNHILINFTDSIFYEKASLEYADLAYIRQDYILAGKRYDGFLQEFAGSSLSAYATYQSAVCKERNGDISGAIENYRYIYLYYPLSEYAEQSYTNIRYLEDINDLEPFTPANEDIIDRAELFFGEYAYNSAIEEYNKLLDGSTRQQSLTSEQHARVLFKLGMCYYNLRDYSTSMQYLLEGYEGYPSTSYADDFLYFLGRAYTNLDNDASAISRYDKLLADYPNSNYADDALYRKGRVYFFQDDFSNALINYQRIISEYPAGDRLREAYWESGWIQYSSDDFEASKDTFKSMASSFRGTSLEEKALFWQAKSLLNLGLEEDAVNILYGLIERQSYSYYTFASSRVLDDMGRQHVIKSPNTEVYPHNPEIASLLPKVYEGIERSESGTYGVITHIDKAKELLGFEFYDSASKELEKGADELEVAPVNILQVSTLYLKAQDYINSQKIISNYYSRLKDSLENPYIDYVHYLLYPYGYKEYVDYYSIQNGVDPLFTLAVIREESRFQPDAGSFAGALGLMQIIPSTGRGIASKLGISGFNTEMLLDPETSIKMGTFYLREQLNNFNENKYFTCGAYNGGPGAMSRWIDENWNGDMDEFIENVSYDETRNYIKKVMGSYYFYSIIY